MTAVTNQARGVDELLEQIERWLPPEYSGLRPLLAGLAAALAAAESGVDFLRPLATLEQGEGTWLTLTGRGVGVLRSSGEADASLRQRIRSVDDQVTRPALQAALDALLDPETAEILEWWEHSYLDVELDDEGGLWLDTERVSGGPSSFLVLVSPRGWVAFGAHVDVDLWLDSPDAIVGDGEATVYAAILNLVNRAKAAGVFWRLCLAA